MTDRQTLIVILEILILLMIAVPTFFRFSKKGKELQKKMADKEKGKRTALEEKVDPNNFVILKLKQDVVIYCFAALCGLAMIVWMLFLVFLGLDTLTQTQQGAVLVTIGLIIIVLIPVVLASIKILKWRLEINGDNLTLKTAFKKPREFTFSDITKVTLQKANGDQRFLDSIAIYIGKKRIGLISVSQIGYYKFVERLKQAGVEIVENEIHKTRT